MFNNVIKSFTTIIVMFVFSNIVCYSQNLDYAKKVESAIESMKSSSSLEDLKEKYKIAINETQTFRQYKKLSFEKGNELTEKINLTYYDNFTNKVFVYFKNSEWNQGKMKEIFSDLDYVYTNTIQTGYIINQKDYDTIKSVINKYFKINQFINQTKSQISYTYNVSDLQRIKETIKNNYDEVIRNDYLKKNLNFQESLKNLISQCDAKINPKCTLELSTTTLSFPSNGGTKYINVICYQNWHLSNVTSPMYTITKENDRIKVVCNNNSSSSSRSNSFSVSIGAKSVVVHVSQEAKPQQTSSKLQSPISNKPKQQPKQEYLYVSSDSLSFISSGERKIITVSASANWHLENTRSLWMNVTRSGDHIYVTCDENNNTEGRRDYFDIICGKKEERINIYQEKSLPKLSLSQESLSFTCDKGEQSIDVKNISNWSLTHPRYDRNWMTAQKKGNQIIVKCTTNRGQVRYGYFDVVYGSQTKRVPIRQYGRFSHKGFNNPKQKRAPLGFSLAYLCHDPYDWGASIGFKAEPLFKHGFGLNTGVNFELYFDNINTDNSVLNTYFSIDNYNISNLIINVPLDFEYRFNIAKKFSMFGFGGIAYNLEFNIKDNKYYGMTLPIEYGGGIRLGSHVQFRFCLAQYFINLNNGNTTIESFPYNKWSVYLEFLFGKNRR